MPHRPILVLRHLFFSGWTAATIFRILFLQEVSKVFAPFPGPCAACTNAFHRHVQAYLRTVAAAWTIFVPAVLGSLDLAFLEAR
jgi:hypothetical protein